MSRDDGGDLDHFEDSLHALASDGASIVIGGADELEAAAIARFADRTHLPVVLLCPPLGAEASSPFVFTLGEDPGEVERALVAALAAAGARPTAVVAEAATPISPWDDVTGRRCGDLGAPYTGVKGLVLGGGEACTRDALGALTTLRIKLAAGFDAEGAPLPLGTLRAAAGSFPFDAAPPAAVRAWIDAHAGAPPWFSALGRDAAVLAYAALQALPAARHRGPARGRHVQDRRRRGALARRGRPVDVELPRLRRRARDAANGDRPRGRRHADKASEAGAKVKARQVRASCRDRAARSARPADRRAARRDRRRGRPSPGP